MRRYMTGLSAVLGVLVVMTAGLAAAGTLDIYFIDVEGGQSTLLVTPTGKTFMIDMGFAGLDTANPDKDVARDATRIAEIAKLAKVTRINTLLTTHFHGDHMSGITHLLEVLPVDVFVDHGPATQEAAMIKQKVGEYSEYWAAAFARGKHVVVAPGDTVPVEGLEVTIVQARGKPTDRSNGPNPFCANIEKRGDGNPEDSASIGVVVRYGEFRFSNFGDLPWNQEVALLCPENRVGTIDVYETPSHGREPSPAVQALAPRIAVLDNNARRGGGAATLKGFKSFAGFEDQWQLHKNVAGGADGNPPDAFTANIEELDITMHPAHFLKVSANEDGSFTVFNSRTNATKAYAARAASGRPTPTR